MNHLEALTAEWLDYNGYFIRTAVHGFAAAADRHRKLGGGRLMTSQELVAEILAGIAASSWKNAVPEGYPLIRTLQIAKMAGAQVSTPQARLIPSEIEILSEPAD